MTKPTLVAIYARVSTGEQNPEAQLLALREYASRRGFSIYKEYVDHVSGDVERRRAKRQNDRAYCELMEDASRRSFDCVLVWKYDRFARSLSILVAGLQQFSTLGIDFISYTQNIDTTTAMGRKPIRWSVPIRWWRPCTRLRWPTGVRERRRSD